MKETFYVKRGRKYVPVREYDNNLMCSVAEGVYVVVVSPGATSWKVAVQPERIPVIAAIQEHRDEIADKIMEVTKAEFTNKKPTKKEILAWEAYCDVLGNGAPLTVSRPSAMEILNRIESLLVSATEKLKLPMQRD